ncbi:MAG: C_GCAxxG_C_C family protein [Lachnospiraceae bacterium]|nr:C_GCAxxG_C_C family protein [Lachnospiraceae bacterium]
MSRTLSRDEIISLFAGHRHCSQVVMGQWAEELDLDEETAVRMMAPFGGGAFDGEMCGAVSGALAVIGARYGHYELGDAEGNQRMIAKVKEFKDAFKERFGTLVCRELLGEYDFSKEGDMQRAAESGIFMEKCTGFVGAALEILEEIMDSE